MTTEAPAEWPVAYCAPGQQHAAALTLALKGERVARILEHPWLEGTRAVILAADPGELLPALKSIPVEPHPDPPGAFATAVFRSMLEGVGIPPVPPWRPSSVI